MHAPEHCQICTTPLTPHELRAGFLCSKPSCHWQYRTLPAHRRCAVCARPLPERDHAREVCTRAECWRTFYVERVQAAKLERQRALEVQVRAWLPPALAAQLQGGTSNVASDDVMSYRITGIPSNQARPTTLSDERRALFHAHLSSVVERAFERRDELADTDAAPPVRYSDDSESPEMNAVAGAACTQCRGQCCRTGASHAFLTPHEILAHLVEHPQHSAHDIVAMYEAYLPAQTLDPGCVYQQESGCALPRAMRSDTCNWFYCDALNDLKREHQPDTPLRAFFVQVGNADPEEGMLATSDFVQLVRRVN